MVVLAKSRRLLTMLVTVFIVGVPEAVSSASVSAIEVATAVMVLFEKLGYAVTVLLLMELVMVAADRVLAAARVEFDMTEDADRVLEETAAAASSEMAVVKVVGVEVEFALAGQSVTVDAQEVMVTRSVDSTVDVARRAPRAGAVRAAQASRTVGRCMSKD